MSSGKVFTVDNIATSSNGPREKIWLILFILVVRLKATSAKLRRFMRMRVPRITFPKSSGAIMTLASPLVAHPTPSHGADAFAAMVASLLFRLVKALRRSAAACCPAGSPGPVTHSICLSLMMLSPLHGRKSSIERTESNTDLLSLSSSAQVFVFQRI